MNVVDSSDNPHYHPLGLLLCSLETPRGYDQDYLGCISEVSPQRSHHQKVPHMLLQVIKRPSHAYIFHISWLYDVGMSSAELKNEQ